MEIPLFNMPFQRGQPAWNRGKKNSKETRRKIGLANKGKKLSKETKKKLSDYFKKHPFWLGKKIPDMAKKRMSIAKLGKNHPNFGKRLSKNTVNKIRKALLGHTVSEETRKKISLAGIGKQAGEKHHNWRGGVTSLNHTRRTSTEYKLWRKSVIERDNYTCQKCGQNGGDLIAHHINNFTEHKNLQLAIDNGFTLCKECHRVFHNRYGYKNNTLEQLNEFLRLEEIV